MLAIEIILVLITVGNAAWAVINYRVTSTLLGRANEVAALVNAMQEQQKEIEEVKAEISALEAKQ